MRLLVTALVLGIICEATASADTRLRWCTMSAEEHNKCSNWTSVACIQAGSSVECIQKITLAEADAVVLHSASIIGAGKCGLVPVMAEYYDPENLAPCMDSAAITKPYVYIVALVKDPTLTWDNLKGKKVCYTALERTAWNIPMGLLITQEKIKNCTLYNSTYFGESCAPGADPDSKLCSLCIGQGSSSEPGKDKCAFNTNERYFGYSGAFRCLTEKGDVTFLKHGTVFENTDGKSQEEWATGLRSNDYRLLCTNGTQVDVTDFKTCHLATVPTRAVVSRAEMRDQVQQFLKEQLLKHGRGGSEEGSFAMFQSTQYGHKHLLFIDSTQCLIDVPTTDYREFLGEKYVTAMEGLYSCVPSEINAWCQAPH
uniref:serotransferrin-B-like n=1 Tax=Pristiophorus japonicus TaxID=55135 RepID=UPI00398E6B4B